MNELSLPDLWASGHHFGGLFWDGEEGVLFIYLLFLLFFLILDKLDWFSPGSYGRYLFFILFFFLFFSFSLPAGFLKMNFLLDSNRLDFHFLRFTFPEILLFLFLFAFSPLAVPIELQNHLNCLFEDLTLVSRGLDILIELNVNQNLLDGYIIEKILLASMMTPDFLRLILDWCLL